MSLTVRFADLQDAAAVQGIYAPVVERTPISFELVPPTVHEIADRIAATLRTHPWLVGVAADRVLGYCYATPHRTRPAYQWCVETAVYIHEDARGRGVGRALYTALLGLLHLQGFHNVYAGITLPNPASVRLHESMGFRPLCVYRAKGCKFGRWHDVGWWEQRIRPQQPDPPAPRLFPEVRDTPDALAALRAATEHGRIARTGWAGHEIQGGAT